MSMKVLRAVGPCSLRTLLGAVLIGSASPAHASGSARDEIRSIVAEMLADAQTRSSLMDTGVTVRYASGFRMESADGASLRIGGRLQFRFASNLEVDDDESGFQARRTRLDFRGTLPDELLSFRIQTDFGRGDGVFDVVDAYVERDLGDGWSVRVGQWKPPFEQEFNVSSRDLITVERSIVSNYFRIDRTQGVMLAYEGDRVRVFAMVNDGSDAANTDILDADEADFGITARAECRVGEASWRQFNTQTGRLGDAFGGLIGAAIHYQQEGAIPRPQGFGGTLDLCQYTVDATFEGDGWNLFGAVVGRVIEGGDESVHDLGVTVQGGFYIDKEWEPFARYSRIMPDGRDTDDDLDFDAITLGINWYPLDGSRNLRVTLEGSYFPQTQADAAGIVGQNTSRGVLLDSSGDQVGLKLQVELFF